MALPLARRWQVRHQHRRERIGLAAIVRRTAPQRQPTLSGVMGTSDGISLNVAEMPAWILSSPQGEVGAAG